MLRELAVNTRVIYYLMALLGIIGVLAKAVNQQTSAAGLSASVTVSPTRVSATVLIEAAI